MSIFPKSSFPPVRGPFPPHPTPPAPPPAQLPAISAASVSTGLEARVSALETHFGLILSEVQFINQREEKLEQEIDKIMTTQADLDAKEAALAAAVKSVSDGLATLKTNLEASIADLQAQLNAAKTGQPLDFTSLDASVASLTAQVASIQSISDEAKAADPGAVQPAPIVNP